MGKQERPQIGDIWCSNSTYYYLILGNRIESENHFTVMDLEVGLIYNCYWINPEARYWSKVA